MKKFSWLFALLVCVLLFSSCASPIRSGGYLEGENFLVSSLVPGQVNEVMVREGERVKEGQPLARIDAEELKINLKNASAALSVLNSELDRARSVLNRLPKSNPMLPRLKQVYEAGGISKAQLNQASSSGNDSSLRSQAELLVRELESQQAKAEAKVEELKTLEAKTTLSSPAEGVVLKRYLQNGQRLKIGDPAFLIANTKKMYLKITLPQKDIDKIAVGNEAVMILEMIPHKSWKGEIIQIETASETPIDRVATLVDPESNRRTIKIQIENPEDSLKPGMKADAKISLHH